MAEPERQPKSLRLSRITYWLHSNPRGLTASQLASRCGVSRRTAQRDLLDLQVSGVPIADDGARPPRYRIIAGYYLPPLHLDLDDALALYLAARLLARYADSYDPHIVEALAKLAAILPEAISRHIHATIDSLYRREHDERFVRVLGVLAIGWATGRKVRIRYRAWESDNFHEYMLSPYFIEPAASGNATHVIGYASYFEALRTFKVERIEGAELSEEPYEMPPDFDGPALLSSAWGIWFGEELEDVVLRFCAAATRRVKETRWHPSQRLEDLGDGGCILGLRLAHPEEMVSWIRGWGPQVEVLAPAALREQVAREARLTAAVYGDDA